MDRLAPGMTEGTFWKLTPVRLFPNIHELALDNDVVLWRIPTALQKWLDGDPQDALIAADVTLAHGKFSALCGPEPRDSGIRGIGPEFDLKAALQRILNMTPGQLESELDEQGLQVAALSLDRTPHVVGVDEVSICSPFHPHSPEFGRCGAHFVGLNAHALPWRYYDRPALEVRREHWLRKREDLYRMTDRAMRPHDTGPVAEMD